MSSAVAVAEPTLGPLYGPYRVRTGKHMEDVPVMTVRVNKVSGPTFYCQVTDADGVKHEERFLTTQTGGDWSCRGKTYNTYLDGRRVVPDEIKAGDDVTLCQTVTYVSEVRDTKGNVLRPGSPPFMSRTELDVRFNQPRTGSYKFERVTEQDKAALDALQAENAALKQALAVKPAESFLDGLKKLSVAELKKVAAEEELDLTGLKSREQILQAFEARDYR